MKPAPHPMRRATRHPRRQPRAPRSVGGYAKGAPQQGDAPTRADRMRALSAASVQRNSRSFQMGDIRALTTICHAASSPIRHALAKEKLTNHVKHSINHRIPPHSTNPTPPDGARARETRTRPNMGRARDTDKHTIAEPATHVNKRPAAAKGKGRARPHAR